MVCLRLGRSGKSSTGSERFRGVSMAIGFEEGLQRWMGDLLRSVTFTVMPKP
jgi:hypothetical protein